MKKGYAIYLILLILISSLGVYLFNAHDLETDIISLIPNDINNPETALVRKLVTTKQSKLTYAVLSVSQEQLNSDAVSLFTKSIEESPHFASVFNLSKTQSMETLGKEIFQLRHFWLLPSWLKSNFPDWNNGAFPSNEEIANTITANLDAFLEKPDSMAWDQLIPSDPFLLVQSSASKASNIYKQSPPNEVLFAIQQIHDPLSKEGQSPIFDALNSALETAKSIHPDAELNYTSVAKFAAASEKNIRSEITRLNIMTSILVLLVLVFWIRNTRLLFKVSMVLIFSISSAFSITFLIFPNLHILSLVMGSLLIGVAVDYALHRFLHETSSQPTNLWRPLLVGALSSAGGFLVLLLSPLPVIQQMGCFVSIGLLSALLAVIILPHPHKIHSKPLRPKLVPFSLVHVIPILLLIALSAIGLFSLHWNDDLKEMDFPLPELKRNDANIRSKFTAENDLRPVLALADSVIEARDNLETLLMEFPQDDQPWSVAQFIPQWKDALLAHSLFQEQSEFKKTLVDLLEKKGYSSQAFEPFFNDFDRYQKTDFSKELFNEQIQAFYDSLPTLMESMLSTDSPAWMLAMIPSSHKINTTEQIFPLAELETLNTSFSLYRKETAQLALIAGALILVLVPFIYKGRKGVLTTLIMLMTMVSSIGLLSTFSDHLTLFHLIGLLLGFCLSLDYVLFAVESHISHSTLPVSILISIATTGGVFAILATSEIPAVHSLGMTVLVIICFSSLLIFSKIIPVKKIS